MTTQNHFLHHVKRLLGSCKYVLFRSGEYPHMMSRDTANSLRRTIELIDKDLMTHEFKKPNAKASRKNLGNLNANSDAAVEGDAAQG